MPIHMILQQKISIRYNVIDVSESEKAFVKVLCWEALFLTLSTYLLLLGVQIYNGGINSTFFCLKLYLEQKK